MAGPRRAVTASVLALALCTAACSGDSAPADPPSPQNGPSAPPSSRTQGKSDPTEAQPSEARPHDASPGAESGPTVSSEQSLSPKEQRAARAAIAAFKKYLRVSDAVMRDGGRRPERLESVATGIMLAADRNGAKRFRRRHEHIEGASGYESLKVVLVKFNADGRSRVRVDLYACVDQSGTKVIDATGWPTDTKNRRLRWPSIYSLSGTSRTDMLVSNVKQRAGSC